MIILVTGGSGSGKSEFAESLMTGDTAMPQTAVLQPRFYVATMQVFGEEGLKKVERHRKLRAGKGFTTIEQTRDVGCIFSEQTKGAALLECMSNLTANEMFTQDGQMPEDVVAAKIVADIRKLAGCVQTLVIVTNNVFEDGIAYDPPTMAYLRVLGQINCELAAMADVVYEVVVGIPVLIKGNSRKEVAK